jgi:putative SOS response-associated peptidase YedK
MCTNFVPSTRHEIAASRLGVLQLPAQDWPDEVFPGYEAPIVLRGGPGEPPRCELARFGLMPRWSGDHRKAVELSRGTYNARSETVAVKPSFRGPWHDRQWALVPMQGFFEPCWEDAALRGGTSVRWQIARADGASFAAAGLWEEWVDPATGKAIRSFTLLTVNADGHPLMGRMHQPGDEKRMPVLVDPGDYARWLHASPVEAASMMRAWPASELRGWPAPRQAASANGSLF